MFSFPNETYFNQKKQNRRNVVYAILNTSNTIARHQQLENFANVFRKHDLVRSILINEYYLRGDDDYL